MTLKPGGQGKVCLSRRGNLLAVVESEFQPKCRRSHRRCIYIFPEVGDGGMIRYMLPKVHSGFCVEDRC